MRAIPLSLILAAAVLAGACSSGPDEPFAMTDDTSATTAATADVRAENDDWITTQVEARFYGDAAVPNDIDVSTDNGIVSLSGEVANNDMRDRALGAARGVDGVVDVRSDLTLENAGGDAGDDAGTASADEPGPVESAWITTKIQSQYFLDGDVKGRNIDVTTRDGIVTLAGFVDNERERQQALRIARDTDDVTDVRDRLRIRSDGEAQGLTGPRPAAERMSDEDLTARVQSKFYLDDDLRADAIDVGTDNGVVTLSGKVENEARRRHAVSVAGNVDGVMDVRDELDVEVGAPRTMRPAAARTPAATRDDDGRDLGDRMGDGWITTKVQAQYYLDTDLKGRNIDVSTTNGVVTLTGEVEGEPQRQLAIQTARETDGVTSVVDHLRIVPPSSGQ